MIHRCERVCKTDSYTGRIFLLLRLFLYLCGLDILDSSIYCLIGSKEGGTAELWVCHDYRCKKNPPKKQKNKYWFT